MSPKAIRRRATRTTARKSTTPVATESLVAELISTAQNDAVLEAEPPTEKLIAEPAPESSQPHETTEEDTKPSNDASKDDAIPQSDVVLGSTSETLAQPDEQAVVYSVNDSVKTKKMVKKTVKVVKKVIKKVSKKVVKGENDGKVENSEKASNPNSSISDASASMEVDDEGKKVDDRETDCKVENLVEGVNPISMISDVSVSVEENDCKVENLVEAVNPSSMVSDVSVSVEENDCKVENLAEVENPGLMISDVSALEEDNKDGFENQDESEKKSSVLMEVDNDESNSVVETDNVLTGEGMNVEEEKDGKQKEDVGDVTGKDDEVVDGKLFSGELEAMERRKRRKTEIFIGGLDKDAKEEDVRKVFSQVGEIVDLRLVMNSKTGKNKGFAFLRYASADSAKMALEKFAKVEVCGRQCGATPVEGNDTIYLGNINKKWKDEDVFKLLQEIGIENIDKVLVMIDPSKSEYNRGFAFVEFETSKDAQIAFKKFHKADVFGRNLNVKVAWAEPLKELDEEEMLKVKTVYAEFIPSSWDEEKVRDTFKRFGEIDDIVLARNLRTTKRKDFAFIYYQAREAAVKCIELFPRELNEDGTKVNVKVSLAKPIQKGKKMKPVAKPAAREIPNRKPRISHTGNLRQIELRNRAPPMVPHYNDQISHRSSTNAELVHLLREQASWRPSHASFNSPIDAHYSNSLPGRKRQFSMLEADPLYLDSGRYPYSRLDASFPVASSSHNVLYPRGDTSSIAYHQQRSGYPSGSVYEARNYPSNIEMRNRAPGSSNVYRRY